MCQKSGRTSPLWLADPAKALQGLVFKIGARSDIRPL